MKRFQYLCASAVLSLLLSGCSSPHGQPQGDPEAVAPSQVSDFATLYSQNCAGCHGAEGRGSAAIALSDPVYLAIADDAVMRKVIANGVSETAMPAFAQSAGGMLTEQQIDAIVAGIRARWAKPDAARGVELPPYAAHDTGDAKRGAGVYAAYCASCHGVSGEGNERASSIVDGA